MGSEIEIGFALVMEAFDKFDQAAGRIITAQPAQMTQAAAYRGAAKILGHYILREPWIRVVA